MSFLGRVHVNFVVTLCTHCGSFLRSLLVAGESTLAPNNITPLARLVAWDVVGCDPEIMGIGPAGAIRGALRKAGLSLADMDLIEVRSFDNCPEDLLDTAGSQRSTRYVFPPETRCKNSMTSTSTFRLRDKVCLLIVCHRAMCTETVRVDIAANQARLLPCKNKYVAHTDQ